MKTVLVTGGAGYVGAVLVPKLLAKGYRVRVFDLFLYADENLWGTQARLETLRGDLRDKDARKKALQGVDTIIHLAGISNDPSSDLDPNLTREVNIEAVKKLIEEAKALGVTRFVNASSSSVYGIKEEPNVTEELSLNPLTVYSESKVEIEKYLEKHRGKMTAVSVRSATVCGYSPRMRLDLAVNILTHHAVTKNKIKVFGGVQKRPNIHIQDITDLYCELVETPKERIDGKAFNACMDNHTVLQLAELVKSSVAPQALIQVEPTDDLRSYHISSQKIKKEIGYSPKRVIQRAIEEVAMAFEDGRLNNVDEEDRYFNVRQMKKILTKIAA